MRDSRERPLPLNKGRFHLLTPTRPLRYNDAGGISHPPWSKAGRRSFPFGLTGLKWPVKSGLAGPIWQRPAGEVRFIPTGLLFIAVTKRLERASLKLIAV